MSNRLMNMKFMQRASASSATVEPPSKRQRLSHGSKNTSPASNPRTDAGTTKANQVAEQQEQDKADRGESKWYLSFHAPSSPVSQAPFQIVSAGFSALDAGRNEDAAASDSDHQPPAPPGRKSFGGFNTKVEKKQNPSQFPNSAASDFSDKEDGDGMEDSQDEDNLPGGIASFKRSNSQASDGPRAALQAKKRAATAELHRMSAERRKKTIDLNGIRSISSGGGHGGSGRGGLSKDAPITCHQCGEKGHKARDCPTKQASSRPRKSY